MLSFSQYLENLDRLRRLEQLQLNGNLIERIEHLEKLANLRELDLSFNKIRKIEGLRIKFRQFPDLVKIPLI